MSGGEDLTLQQKFKNFSYLHLVCFIYTYFQHVLGLVYDVSGTHFLPWYLEMHQLQATCT